MSGEAEAEEVEQRDGECDDNSGVKHRRRVNHLMPTARQVEEWGNRRVACENRHCKHNADRAKEAFKTDGDQRSDGVTSHNLFCLRRMGIHE